MDGAPVREAHGIAPDDFVIGFAGSVERWYALDRVIGAMPAILERVPEALLLIVGGSLFTGYLPELRALAERLGVADRVRFAGAQPYAALPGFIGAMDVCTIPLAPPQWVDIALPNKFFEYLGLRQADPLDADPGRAADRGRAPPDLPGLRRVRRRRRRARGDAAAVRDGHVVVRLAGEGRRDGSDP